MLDEHQPLRAASTMRVQASSANQPKDVARKSQTGEYFDPHGADNWSWSVVMYTKRVWPPEIRRSGPAGLHEMSSRCARPGCSSELKPEICFVQSEARFGFPVKRRLSFYSISRIPALAALLSNVAVYSHSCTAPTRSMRQSAKCALVDSNSRIAFQTVSAS